MKPWTLLLAAVLLPALSLADEHDWISQSNEAAQPVLDVLTKYSPEFAAQLGVAGYDEEITDLKPGIYERSQADFREVLADLQTQLASADHPKVEQDLNILITSVEDQLRTAELQQNLMLPYFNLPQILFFGFQSLLDPRLDAERYPAALVRLKRYNGTADGYEPIANLARARTAERFEVDGLTGPYQEEVEKNLNNTEQFVGGIRDLFENSGLEGWQEDFDVLASQLNDYQDWVREEVLSRARENHRLPPEIYADNLKNFGVTMDPRDLMRRAQFGFAEIRGEMQSIAQQIAERDGLESADYRDVMAHYKNQQIPEGEVLELYQRRLAELEDIIRREDIITLPERDAIIRLATEAEAAGVPAPHLNIPPLIGNTGEQPEFVLVQNNPNAETDARMDDWSHDGVTWTLTVHEARPGHELQISSIIEKGVSIPRGIFAFNSANVEGWALYAEAVMKPYLPLEGQLFSLQGRLQRAARAFLDPMLNLGQIEPAAAKSFIMEEVGLSEAMAAQEVDRYTFRAPGQATSYYYGYMQLQRLRTLTELRLRDDFEQKAFHDFILAQGLLPPELLQKAIVEEFIPAQTGQEVATTN